MMSKATEEFWTSEKGILVRLEDLAHDFVLRTYNGAVKGAFKEAGITRLKWITDIDLRRRGGTCNICLYRHGKVYHTGMFLPRMPVHNHCKCGWDIKVELS